MTERRSDARPSAGVAERRRTTPWVRLAAVFAALLAAVGFLLAGGADEAFVYSKRVDEVVGQPQRFQGRRLRVEGRLVDGTVRFREQPCEWRFVLTSGGRRLQVRYPRCVVPDTFREGMNLQVVVEGRLHSDGTFEAHQVLPRCPSRYDPAEHERLKRSGRKPPHEV